jgi:diamine N-acetyltransferase
MTMDNPILHEDDLILRAPELSDLQLLYAIENDAEMWPEGCATGPYSRRQLEQFILHATNDVFADGQLRLMMVDTATGEVVGMIDLIDFNPRHSRAEVGVMVLPEYRQKRWASRALRLLARHCFGFLGIHQLYAYIAEDNTPCRALFAACGFRECANLHQWVRADYGFKDVVMVQMLNSLS